MVTEWPFWWCCLSDGWRDMFNFLGSLTPTPDVMAFRTVYDSNFESFIAPTDSWLYDYFNTSFEVHFATVDIPGLGDTEMAIWGTTTWLQFQLWTAEDGYTCPDPCPYTSPPFNLPD